MSDINSGSPKDASGRTQSARRQEQIFSDLAKSVDVQHHNSSLLHQFGQAFDAPQTVADLASGVGFVGIAESPARSDHIHGSKTFEDAVCPAGTMRWTIYGGTEVGWISINGGTYVGAQTAYPSLWAVVPASWKSGANLVTPDCRNRFVINNDGTRAPGTLLGSNTSALSPGNLPAHAHGGTSGFVSADHAHGDGQGTQFVITKAGGGVYAGGIGGSGLSFTGGITANHNHAFTTDNGPGSSAPFNTYPACVDLYMKMRAY